MHLLGGSDITQPQLSTPCHCWRWIMCGDKDTAWEGVCWSAQGGPSWADARLGAALVGAPGWGSAAIPRVCATQSLRGLGHVLHPGLPRFSTSETGKQFLPVLVQE